MAEVQFGVAVLLEGAAAIEVQALRRALGARDLDAIEPHITVVPPIPVATGDLDAAIESLRTAARQCVPFRLGLGAPATFAPVSPTVHLPVTDPDGALHALRELVFRPPLYRRTHPFVPHVTLLAAADEARIAAACGLLAGYRGALQVRRLTLLVLRHEPRRWEPFVDVDLDGVRVVGAGPLAVQLSAGSVAEPAAWRLRRTIEAEATGPPPGRHRHVELVVTARRERAVVGTAWGPWREVEPAGVVVEPAARRQGLGTLLQREWRFRAEQRSTLED